MSDEGARDLSRARPAMPFLRLAPDTGFCLIRGDAVFLDLRRDRYFRLAGAAAEAFERARSAGASPIDPEDSAQLIRTGLLEESAAPATLLPAEAPPIIASLPEQAELGSPRLGPLIKVAAWLARTRRALKRRRLLELVTKMRSELEKQGPSPQHGLTRKAAMTFLAARPLVPIQPNCLLDSLALTAYLRAGGTHATLVFGVRLDPFAAHCWLQEGTTVLNDSVDNVADFSPILVV